MFSQPFAARETASTLNFKLTDTKKHGAMQNSLGKGGDLQRWLLHPAPQRNSKSGFSDNIKYPVSAKSVV